MDAENLTIPVVVVESHQHVLEHIHAVLRHRARTHSRKVRRAQKPKLDDENCSTCLSTFKPATTTYMPPPISLIHFDSHPDLACPSTNVPAVACFEPRKKWQQPHQAPTTTEQEQDDTSCTSRNLYEYLDLDRSGIAQWILPLVLSGDLNTVHWVRSSWADQIRDGIYAFRVGAWLSSLTPSAHRRLDGEANKKRPQSFVDLPQTAAVKVNFCHPYYFEDNSVVPTEELLLPQKLQLVVSELAGIRVEKSTELARPEVAKNEGKDWILDICLDYFVCDNPFRKEIELIDAHVATSLFDAIRQASFCSSSPQYQQFHTLITRLLRMTLAHPTTQRLKANENAKGRDYLLDLYTFYKSQTIGEAVIEELVEAIGQSSADPQKLVHFAIDALPSMSLPKDDYLCGVDALSGAITQIKSLTTLLQSGISGYKQRPIMITIARSSDDGFTPNDIVEKLQQEVLEMVHSVYCDCKEYELYKLRPKCKCMLKFLFDFGEWEGSELEFS